MSIVFAYFPTNLNAEFGSTTSELCSFEQLKSKHPTQSSLLWKALSLGIDKVKSDKSPAIYLLVYGDAMPDQLINNIVNWTSFCMKTNFDPLRLDHTNFSSAEMEADYGVAIDRFHTPLIESQVMLVNNLNKVFIRVRKSLTFN